MIGRGRGRGRGDGERQGEGLGVQGGVVVDGVDRQGGRGHGNGSANANTNIGRAEGRPATEISDINRSGFATGVAHQGGTNRGTDVPLPVPKPTKGNANDITNIWCHGKSLEGASWSCGYCGMVRLGGGATRLKQHIAGLGPEVNSCMSAPHHVVAIFRKEIPDGRDKRRKVKEGKKRVEDEVNHVNNQGVPIHINVEDEDDEMLRSVVQASLSEDHGRTKVVKGSVGSSSSGVKDFFDVDLAYSKTRPQQTMEVCLNKVEYESRIGKAWAKWFHANDIPGHKANCPYFVGAVKLTQELGKGVPVPKGIDIDGAYLNSNYEECKNYVAKFKDDWPTYGVTIMSDSWTGPSRMSIINFMVYSNGRMYFHKSVNATGHMQNSHFVYEHIKEVIEEIGAQNVVQLVTDNGSNFKKACLDLVALYQHITWQPCAAHTINLMLKEMGCFPQIDGVVSSCKRICRFMYNHSTLHAEMREHIGGELVRPNATRFGTNFMFLESFWDRQDKFKVWMTSSEWKNSQWSSEDDYDYTYDCLISRIWWENLKRVIDIIGPLYSILRYADSQKLGSLSGFMSRMMNARHHLSSSFPLGSPDHDMYLKVVDKRVEHLYKDTLMVAAGVLDPEGHYKHNFGRSLPHLRALNAALRKLSSPEEFIQMIPEIDMYTNTRGAFEGMYPRSAASKSTPTQWWLTFGDSTPLLQKYAIRIISQCTSSSGCERNWSTYALVHTLVRNRLGFEKLHKLVFCHYNLGLRMRLLLGEPKEKEVDTCALLMNASLYDSENDILDWLGNSTSESMPSTDEYDHDAYHITSPVVLEVGQRKRSRGKKLHVGDGDEEEEDEDDDDEEEEEEEEEEDEEDGEDEGNNDVLLPPNNNEPLRKSTRARRKRKLASL